MKTILLVLVSALAAGAQTTTINGGRTILGVLDASGATRTAPAKSGTSLPGTCTVGDEYNKTDATNTAVKHICTATNTWTQQTGSSSSALTSNAGDAIFYPNGEPGTYSTATLTANTVYLEAFQTQVSMQFRNMWAYVATAAAAGKGMRGLIYTRASNGDITVVAKTAGILCDTTTTKVMAWSSGSLVSGGVLTLPAGQNYYVGLVSDGAPIIYSYNTNAGAGYLIRNGWNGSSFVAKIMASSTDGVTGTGVNVDVGASITNANINAGVDRRVLLLPLAP